LYDIGVLSNVQSVYLKRSAAYQLWTLFSA